MNTRTDQVLHVAIGGVLAGTLTCAVDDRLTFRYNDTYGSSERVVPLSMLWSPDGGDRAHVADNWFANLVSENEAFWAFSGLRRGILREAAFHRLGTPAGLDCAGAVQCALDPAQLSSSHTTSQREHVTSEDVARLVTATAFRDTDTLASTKGARRFVLAGAQPKVALGLEPSNQRWYLPSTSEPSTHIIKPQSITLPTDRDRSGWPNLVVVEHLTMATARGCGMPVAATRLRRFGEVQAIVVERYDRIYENGVVLRLHQEDLCQALDVDPSEKFEDHGGPSTRIVTRQIQEVSSESAARFFEALVFNWVIAGSDAHAKNYSILLTAETAALAPLYDVISALPYAPIDRAEEIGLVMQAGAQGRRVADFDVAQAWVDTSAMCGVKRSEALESMERIVSSVEGSALAAYEALEPEFANLPEASKYVVAVESRAETARRVVEEFAELA